MSFLIKNIQTIGRLCHNGIMKPVMSARNCSQAAVAVKTDYASEISKEYHKENAQRSLRQVSYINKDRSEQIPVETSIKYMDSEAYKATYGEDPVWKLYRRNFKGQFAPKKTRKTCIRSGVVSTGNPCPICRDEYLVLDYRNTKLLNQFVSEFNGETLSYQVTNICQSQYKRLLVAIKKARDCGILTYDPPLRTYNYSHWYKPQTIEN